MTEQKVYTVGGYRCVEAGPLTKADVVANPSIVVGHLDDKGEMVIGACFMMTEHSVSFNPYAEYAWYEIELSRMVKLQEIVD